MLDVHFVYLGAAIGVVGQAVYVVDTIRGRTQPNRVTWLLWAVNPLLAFAVEVDDKVGLRSLMTFVVGFGPLVVFAASFVNRRSVWKLGALDYTCGAMSVVGTIGWLVTGQGLVALAAALAADFLAGVPTLVKSWQDPASESASIYVGGFLNAVITLLTVNQLSAAVVAFPLYITVIGLVEISLVAGRIGPRLRRDRAGVGSSAERHVVESPVQSPVRSPVEASLETSEGSEESDVEK